MTLMDPKLSRLCLAGAALAAAFWSTGCVERQLSITSEPSGALVYLSDVEVGRTPLTVDFEWYGDYEVILRSDGYQTLQTNTKIDPPWYDIPPWDLVSQAFVPWTYYYRVNRHFTLEPLKLPDDQTLIDNALDLQQRNLEPVER